MPFAGYENFEECVQDNQDKANPEAFCAWLHYESTGEWPGRATKDFPVDFDTVWSSMTECIERMSQEDMEEPEAFCAAWYYDTHGIWPAERPGHFQSKEGGGTMPHRPDDSFEVTREKVERKVWQTFDNPDGANGQEPMDMIAVHTFPDSVIVKNMVDDRFYEVPYVKQGNEVYLGQMKEVESVYVYKKLEEHSIDPATKSGLAECELTGPIVMKDNEKKIAYAAVLVPNEPDSDGETVTKEKIEQAAHEWMLNYGNVDLGHTLNNVAVPVESYITPVDITTEKGVLPAGTWILASKVYDDQTWQAVKDGNLTGYSVMGIKRQTLEAATKSEDVALKKTLLRDLGPDWVAAAVSIVEEPAVPKAKFFALKEAKPEENKPNLYERIAGMFKGQNASEKAGRSISEENYAKLKEAFDRLRDILEIAENERTEPQRGSASQEAGKQKENDGGDEEVTKEEIQELVQGAVKEAVEPLQQEIEALKNQGEGQEGEGQGEEETLESFKQQVVERLEKLEQTSSKSLKGQDGEGSGEEKSAFKGRDFFGRKVAK